MFYVPNMSDVMSDIWEGQGDMTLSQASEAELVRESRILLPLFNSLLF